MALTLPLAVPLAIPSPPQSVWHLGPLPIRAYALAIMVGIVVAVWIARRRWAERGGDPDTVLEIAFWAVPFGIVGGRIYHVISSPDAYFGVGGDPVRALYIWEGGLGIWGAIALGAVGAWIGARRQGVSFAVFADVVAPALLVAQAIGRLGNWFNQELFGGPTTLPWGLRIDPTAPTFPVGDPPGTLFHPTFLYELLWNLAAAALHHLARTAAAPRARPGVLGLRDGVHHRAAVDRDAAHRPGTHDPGAAPQRLDLDPGVAGCAGSLRAGRAPSPWARDHGGRDGTRGHGARGRGSASLRRTSQPPPGRCGAGPCGG